MMRVVAQLAFGARISCNVMKTRRNTAASTHEVISRASASRRNREGRHSCRHRDERHSLNRYWPGHEAQLFGETKVRILILAVAGVLSLATATANAASPGSSERPISMGAAPGIVQVGGGCGPGWHPVPGHWSQWRGGWVPPRCAPNRYYGDQAPYRGWGGPYYGGGGAPGGGYGPYGGGGYYGGGWSNP
jgi:hypothetical protein